MNNITPVFEEIQALVNDNPVILFMKGTPEMPSCGFSSLVVQVLNRLCVEFKGVNVLASEEMRQGIKDFTRWPTIPQLYIRGEFIGGADIVRELYTSGELCQIFERHNIPYKAAQQS